MFNFCIELCRERARKTAVPLAVRQRRCPSHLALENEIQLTLHTARENQAAL